MVAVLCAIGAFLGFAMALSHAPSSGVIRLGYADSGIIILFGATLGAFICLCLPPYRKDEKHGLSCRIFALLTTLFSLLILLHLYMMSGID
ncbi:MAG: hypothetical protein EPN97_06225 [Alphaproteobacteria bacterium]|nr:MAG: hypothetical protein EPN97_06225 [Alphaproteobacteria bacterium]